MGHDAACVAAQNAAAEAFLKEMAVAGEVVPDRHSCADLGRCAELIYNVGAGFVCVNASAGESVAGPEWYISSWFHSQPSGADTGTGRVTSSAADAAAKAMRHLQHVRGLRDKESARG